jgi:hypothetical protein
MACAAMVRDSLAHAVSDIPFTKNGKEGLSRRVEVFIVIRRAKALMHSASVSRARWTVVTTRESRQFRPDKEGRIKAAITVSIALPTQSDHTAAMSRGGPPRKC